MYKKNWNNNDDQSMLFKWKMNLLGIREWRVINHVSIVFCFQKNVKNFCHAIFRASVGVAEMLPVLNSKKNIEFVKHHLQTDTKYQGKGVKN